MNGLTTGGLIAQNNEGATFVDVDTTAGVVNGATFGVHASNGGDGDITVRTGDVTSLTQAAVLGQNLAGTGDVSIDTTEGTLSAGSDGIFADQFGTGSVIINAGDVTAANNAIWARTEADTVAINVAGELEASAFAIQVIASQAR